MGVAYTRKLWTGPEVKKLKRLAQQGIPAVCLAKELGRSRWSIMNKARELGIKLSYPSGEDYRGTTIPDRYIQAIRVMRDAGLTPTQISDIFKYPHRVSTGYVKRICADETRNDAIRR